MSKPRFLKPLLIGCACLVPVGLIVGLSVNWDHTKTISCLGSGGVKPFVEAFGEEFRKNNSGYDVTVDTGGSTFGITQVAGGYCNYGNASKNPYHDVHSENDTSNSWINNDIKTVTIGWEAVSVLYCLPNNLSESGKKNIDLYVCKDNINYLFAAFSGFDEYLDSNGQVQKLDTIHTSFYEFLTPKAKASLSENDLKICKDTQIAPVARSGAATVANSAFSFVYESNLNPNLTDKQLSALIGGQYGTDRTVIETDESNAKGYEIFDHFATPGMMVYLTSAFTEPTKTREIINSHTNYKFMSYQGINDTQPVSYAFNNFDAGYDWVRPINIMCSLNKNHKKYEDNKKFLDFIFQDLVKYEALLKKSGAKRLSATQYDSMRLNQDFWVSDAKLEESRSGQDKEIYGAIR